MTGPEQTTAPFVFAGESVRARIRVDQQELARRTALEGGWLTQLHVLEALFVMPPGAVVASESLPRWARHAGAEAPTWAIEREGESWRRLYQPIANLHEIVLDEPGSTKALTERLVALRNVASVALLATDIGAAMKVIEETQSLGVGVAVAEGDSWWMATSPEIGQLRPSAQRWLLEELAAAAVRPRAGAPSSRP
ncbi:MAG: hypothetical protein JWM89_1316 [Acidimicrobiales bacterium]|nr:hypothetical protein [Acidimicrobiales bacterium]